ncbi:MAG: hypothetical protein WA958_14885 [Tunicatimonas sp.]
MKTKLLFACAALGLLFAACEDKIETIGPTEFNGPYNVKVYAGMPGVYGRTDGGSEFNEPQANVAVKIYRTREDYLLSQNVILEGLTNEEGLFAFEYDSAGSLWFSAQLDTLSNLREAIGERSVGSKDNNQLINRFNGVTVSNGKAYATLTNTPTRLQLSVSHQGQPVEGAAVQLYFTEQTYQDSLAAQEDFDHLRPTYGYFVDEEGTTGEERYFVNQNKERFLQTTNEAGEVYFDNLEPRNYWFRITKDTLSNEGTVVRTREALPRDADISNIMTVGIR